METYVYPEGIEQDTEVVVNVYVEYPDQDSFYQDYPHPSGDTIENIENNYTVNNEFKNNFYFGNGSAPSLAQAVFQALLIPPAITAGAAALDAARAYAQAQLISSGSNALLTGASAIHEATSALVLEGSAAAGEYGLGFALGLAADASVCGIAALLGYKIGENIVTETGAADLWSDFLLAADPWKLKTPGSLMGKILGIQYGDKTYIDSRLYNAIKARFDASLPQFKKNIPDVQIGDHVDDFGADLSEGSTRTVTKQITIELVRETNKYHIEYTAVLNYSFRGSGNILLCEPYGYVNPQSPNSSPIVNCGAYYTGEYNSFSVGYTVAYHYTDKQTGTAGTGSVQGTMSPGTRTQKTVVYDGITYRAYQVNCAAAIFPAVYLEGASISPATGSFPITIGGTVETDAFVLAANNIGVEDSEYPEGVEEWQGEHIEDPSSGAIHIVIDINTNQTIPYYPMSFPSAPYSFPTYNPTTQPNPTTVYDPRTQIQPYAVPWPQQNPTSDPTSNPSSPTIIPVPIILPSSQPGKDDGETPDIEAPVIAPPFDLSYSYGGLFNVFNPTAQQLHDFGKFLWVSWTDATLSKIINNPFDGVISLHELYATPNQDTPKIITSGFLASNVSAATVTNRYSEIDCGTIVVPEYFNNYLDYTPYTSAYAYLPFIGIVELNADDIVGHAINIKYRVDSYSGACVAFITVARSDGLDENYSEAVYQFEGNCAVQLPISGGSQAAITAGLWQTGSKAIGNTLLNIIGGSEAGALNGATSLISGVSNTLLTRKSEVQHSGTMSSNFGAMAGKKPYIIVKRPRQVVVTNYNLDYGYPAHAMVTIGQCQGYLRVREVNVISATATDEEKQEIESLLKAGVYVS